MCRNKARNQLNDKKKKCLVVDALGCGEEMVVKKERKKKMVGLGDCEWKNEVVGRIGWEKVVQNGWKEELLANGCTEWLTFK